MRPSVQRLGQETGRGLGTHSPVKGCGCGSRMGVEALSSYTDRQMQMHAGATDEELGHL